MEDIEALSSASEAGEVEVVSAPPPPAQPACFGSGGGLAEIRVEVWTDS